MLPEEIIASFFHAEAMKRLERTGWNLAGVQVGRRESVAEHVWGTLFLSWLLSIHFVSEGESVDQSKILTMVLLHDLPESLISDIPRPAIELGGEQMRDGKSMAEYAALRKILPSVEILQKTSKSLVSELEERKSIESRIVGSADILDMLLHAISLERGGVNATTLDQFFKSSEQEIDRLDLDMVRAIYQILNKEHESNL